MTRSRRILFIFCAAALYGLRYVTALPDGSPRELGFYTGRALTARGIIVKAPEYDTLAPVISVEVDSVRFYGAWIPVEGIAELRAVPYADALSYGDRIEVYGSLAESIRPSPRISGTMKRPRVTVLSRNENSWIVARLIALKTFFVERLNRFLPEPAGSFAAALLFGSRSALPREEVDAFRIVGLTHILAISGYNMVVLIGCVTAVCAWLPRTMARIAAIFVIALFTVLVGASASVVRAAIMGSLSLIAGICGRKSAGMRSLCITGFAMGLFDPFIVLHDIGFQLSFAATAGLIVCTRRLQSFLEKVAPLWGVRDAFLTTISAQVFTTPLILFYFKGISLIAPVANLFALPLIPLLMLGSFLTLVFGTLAAGPTWLLFKILFAIVHVFAGIPFSFFDFSEE